MGKKLQVTNDHGDVIDVELDDDITEDDLDKHPEQDNALSEEELQQIESDEEDDQLGE